MVSGDTVATIEKALDELLADNVPPIDAREATALIRTTERLARQLRAVHQHHHRLLQRSGVHASDGYPSAKALTRHVARLSTGEAAARERGARLRLELPEVWGALAEGTLGIDQLDLLARIHANPRMREAMPAAQAWFLRQARRLSYADFEIEAHRWERLAESTVPSRGTPQTTTLARWRSCRIRSTSAGSSPGRSALFRVRRFDDILRPYADAERLADWDKARAEHGDDAHTGHLPRSEAQRRADALWRIFQDAAAAEASPVGVDFVHHVVWDAATFEETLRRLSGEQPRPFDPESSTCRTIDGVPLEPTEAGANALVSHFRRVVIDSSGVVIDLGRARLFTGGSRLAVQLSEHHCPWPGCRVPTSRCEIDHTVDHAKGGRTHPGNGGPFCGKHNRWKQKGFAVSRDPTGQWHFFRPDGSEFQ